MEQSTETLNLTLSRRPALMGLISKNSFISCSPNHSMSPISSSIGCGSSSTGPQGRAIQVQKFFHAEVADANIGLSHPRQCRIVPTHPNFITAPLDIGLNGRAPQVTGVSKGGRVFSARRAAPPRWATNKGGVRFPKVGRSLGAGHPIA